MKDRLYGILGKLNSQALLFHAISSNSRLEQKCMRVLLNGRIMRILVSAGTSLLFSIALKLVSKVNKVIF